MTRFQLFDSIQLQSAVALDDGEIAPAGTPGAVVERLGEGEAYLVELFGEWVKLDAQGRLGASTPDDPEAFMKSLGVATVAPEQILITQEAAETMGPRLQLLALAESLPEALLEEVVDFAEFLLEKQRRRQATPTP